MNTTPQLVALMLLDAHGPLSLAHSTRYMAGKPQFAWSLQAALGAGIFDEIHVMTGDVHAAQMAREVSPAVRIASPASDGDAASIDAAQAWQRFCTQTTPDALCLISPAAPLVTPVDLAAAWQRFRETGADVLNAAVNWTRAAWPHGASPSQPCASPFAPSQTGAGLWLESGAFCFAKPGVLASGTPSGASPEAARIEVHALDALALLDTAHPAHWQAVEHLLRHRATADKDLALRNSLRDIRALVVDVDGTLTDGGMYYDADGEALKKFNTKDAQGMKMLEKQGTIIGVITAEDTPRVHSRMKKLQFDNYHFGIKDKLPLLKSLCQRWGIEMSQVAYVGDDLGDQACIQAAGFSACPADAEACVRPYATYITRRRAGEGAVREVCDLILAAQSPPTTPPDTPQGRP